MGSGGCCLFFCMFVDQATKQPTKKKQNNTLPQRGILQFMLWLKVIFPKPSHRIGDIFIYDYYYYYYNYYYYYYYYYVYYVLLLLLLLLLSNAILRSICPIRPQLPSSERSWDRPSWCATPSGNFVIRNQTVAVDMVNSCMIYTYIYIYIHTVVSIHMYVYIHIYKYITYTFEYIYSKCICVFYMLFLVQDVCSSINMYIM